MLEIMVGKRRSWQQQGSKNRWIPDPVTTWNYRMWRCVGPPGNGPQVCPCSVPLNNSLQTHRTITASTYLLLQTLTPTAFPTPFPKTCDIASNEFLHVFPIVCDTWKLNSKIISSMKMLYIWANHFMQQRVYK